MTVYGLANHAPDFMLLYLSKYCNADNVVIVDADTVIQQSAPYFLFLDTKALRRNLDRVNELDAIGIVCDSTLKLKNFEGIYLVDAVEAENYHIDAFQLRYLKKKKKRRKSVLSVKQNRDIVYAPYNYALSVQEKVESFTGILTPFMTFVYTMPSSTHQKPVKELACSWLVNGESRERLMERANDMMKTVPMTEKQQTRFYALLFSEAADVYHSALQEAKHIPLDALEFKDVASKYGVSAYEMRYMLSVVKAIKD